MNAVTYTVSNPLIRQFMISFPILEQDLGVFLNGMKLNEYQYTFSQSTNSVTIHHDLNKGDTVSLRVFKVK